MCCSAPVCADLTISTWDQEWLEVNFKPALFVAMPWLFLSNNVVVDKGLAQEVVTLRSQGLSFEVIAATRNERIANRSVCYSHHSA